MGQSTWADKATTWSADTNIWANDTYQNSITINGSTSTTLGYNTKYPVTANLAQVILSELNEEDAIKLASAILGLSTGTTASASVIAPVSISLGNEQNLKNNVNFEESISIGVSNLITSSNNFLWNDTEEDTSTAWTKVADPDN